MIFLGLAATVIHRYFQGKAPSTSKGLWRNHWGPPLSPSVPGDVNRDKALIELLQEAELLAQMRGDMVCGGG
eukprot:m.272608 g.272608  ORF g.272608 m.272608 type:complete len:72 (+) comp40567_c0_seq6:642-857(+)